MSTIEKAIVLVSLDQAKLKDLGEKARRQKVMGMAKCLRSLAGVRQIEGIQFRHWMAPATAKAPWEPHGALLVVEARDRDRLTNRIKEISDAAAAFDQELMVLEPLGDLDSW